MWHLYPNEIPPDIPENEDFGVEYEVRYRLPNGFGKDNGIVFILLYNGEIIIQSLSSQSKTE